MHRMLFSSEKKEQRVRKELIWEKKFENKMSDADLQVAPLPANTLEVLT